jgi:hypothetical protein
MISAWFRLVRSKTFRVLPRMRTYLMTVLQLSCCRLASCVMCRLLEIAECLCLYTLIVLCRLTSCCRLAPVIFNPVEPC